MSKNDYFVDTELLRDHVSKLKRQKKLAYLLYDNINAMKQYSDPSMSYQYNSVLRDVEQLIQYFEKMAETLDHIDDKAVQLSQTIGDIIEDDTERLRRKTSEIFML